MSHIWHWNNAEDAWAAVELAQSAFVIVPGAAVPLCAIDETASLESPLLIQDSRDSAGDRWLLLVRNGTGVLVNGDRVELGVRSLRDRDELLVLPKRSSTSGSNAALEHLPLYFSTERLPRVEAFAAGPRPVICARCHGSITEGNVVRCPNPRCRQYHHQADAQPCWAHLETCAAVGCGWPTHMTQYRWVPNAI
jgi:hypothetical protein